MKKRFLSILLAFCMVMAFVPQVVFAEGITGAFTVTGGTFGIDYYYDASNKTLEILTGAPITISGTTYTDKIFVKEEVLANITLAGVNIDLSSNAYVPAIALSGNTIITLAENTTNTVKSGFWCAGILNNRNLEIKGSGTLDATGGERGAGIGGNRGYGGAGIGGGYNGNGSNITISGGTVNATGGYGGAGIGGGYNGDGSNITISGGTVNATGGEGGAGIGGGYYGNGSNITINGGTVNATGGYGGAGIGGGYNGNGSNIIISGGSVKAKGNNDIGGGMSGSAVCPKADDGTNVYLITIDNRNSDTVYIDGNEYQPVNHTSADSSNTNLYAYLTGTNHIIKVGENVVNYHFDSTTFSECKDDNKDHLCDVCSAMLSEHSGGQATCTSKAVCDYCKTEYGELDSTNHNLKKISAKDATVTEKGNKEYWHCLDCNKYFADENGTNEINLDDTVIPKLPPEIIDGKGQNVTKGEKKEITFRSNAAFSDFIRVELDGKTLDKKNYTVKEGSTVVTLKADYVATLSVGEHTIGIVSESGNAATTFTVSAKVAVANDKKSPQTGDSNHMVLWLALLFVSGSLMTVTGIYGKKKKYNT